MYRQGQSMDKNNEQTKTNYGQEQCIDKDKVWTRTMVRQRQSMVKNNAQTKTNYGQKQWLDMKRYGQEQCIDMDKNNVLSSHTVNSMKGKITGQSKQCKQS